MRVWRSVAAAFACALVAGAFAATAAPSAMPAGGQIRGFSPQSGDQATNPILITGAVGDYGTATSMDKNGKPDPNGDYVRITLKKGGFEVNSVALDKKLANAPGVFNKGTCSFSFEGTGQVTVSKGTGLYKGISGSLAVTVDFAGVGPRLTSGPHKGECNPSNNAKPLDQYGVVIINGTVKFA